MRIHLEQIPDQGVVLEFEASSKMFPVLAEMVKKGECDFLTPIQSVLRVLRFEDMVEVEGKLSTSVRLTCDRCLKPFEFPLKSRFAITYTRKVPEADEDTGQREVELQAGDFDFIYFQGQEINLQGAIQEQIVLAFPFRALCRPTCKGLCPRCGTDLNQGDCGCERLPAGGKFIVLQKLKLDIESKG